MRWTTLLEAMFAVTGIMCIGFLILSLFIMLFLMLGSWAFILLIIWVSGVFWFYAKEEFR